MLLSTHVQVLALQPASAEDGELHKLDEAASASWLAACAAEGPAEEAGALLEAHAAEAHRWLARQAARMLSQENGEALPGVDAEEDTHHMVEHGNGHAPEQPTSIVAGDRGAGVPVSAAGADGSGAVAQQGVNGSAQGSVAAQEGCSPAAADAAFTLFPGLITGLQPSEAAGLVTWAAWQAALTGLIALFSRRFYAIALP